MAGEQLQQAQNAAASDPAKDDRTRDLVGRLSAKITELEKRDDERNNAFEAMREEMELLQYPDQTQRYNQTYGQPAPQPQPNYNPAATPGFKVVQDVQGNYYRVAINSQQQPQMQPQPNQPAQNAQEKKFLEDQFNRVCDDIQFHGKVHPQEADALGRAIMDKHVRTGKPVEQIQREMAKTNPVIKTVLKAQVESLANLTGAKVTFDEVDAGVTQQPADAVAQPQQAQPAIVPEGQPVPQPLPNSQGVAVTETPEIAPPVQQPTPEGAIVAPSGLGTERNNMPPVVDAAVNAEAKAQNVEDSLDNAIFS